MRKTLAAPLLALLASAPAWSAGLAIDVEIPRLDVAEYHRPYVAYWIEREDNSVAANLAVWYDLKMKDKEGEKWLKDMRQWWRRSGRSLEMPVDGVSSATLAPGRHTLSFTQGKAPLGDLPAGNYRLVVEAAREVGGREVITLPFAWPPAQATESSEAGSNELGAVTLTLQP
jgi:hypothetical protein